MSTDRFEARYRLETPHTLREAAEVIAGEQSSGTFVEVEGESSELHRRHGARVERVVETGTAPEPSLPGSNVGEDGETYRRGEVTISFPTRNVGASLPNLLTTVGGNIFELQELSGIRLLDVEPPDPVIEAYPGPQFGVEGTRDLAGVRDRPLLGTIIKPNVGLSPGETGDLVETLVTAGVDFIKDDELIANPPYSPVKERVAAVMDAIHRHRAETDTNVLYACNITGDIEEMKRNHDAVVDAGGNCVMVSVESVGLAGLVALREHAEVPIHVHRNGWGARSRSPMLGFDFRVYQKFLRLAGADHVHVSGIDNKFAESDESVIESAIAVQTPIEDDDDVAVPVFSSAQWAKQAPETYAALGNTDLMHLAGGGILGHPEGPAAGVVHLRQGWEAAMKGVDLKTYAEGREELRRALAFFGDDDG